MTRAERNKRVKRLLTITKVLEVIFLLLAFASFIVLIGEDSIDNPLPFIVFMKIKLIALAAFICFGWIWYKLSEFDEWVTEELKKRMKITDFSAR